MKDHTFKEKKMEKVFYGLRMVGTMKEIFLIIFFMVMESLISLINSMKEIEYLIKWKGILIFIFFI